MSCTKKCHNPSPSQAHCAACHHTFAGVGWFDEHRVNGKCIEPTLNGRLAGRNGVYDTPEGHLATQARVANMNAARSR
jgi:hypothetical protein